MEIVGKILMVDRIRADWIADLFNPVELILSMTNQPSAR